MSSANEHGGQRMAILYARVSTDEQARTGFSLAQQIERLREYAEAEGLAVLEEVVDRGQSGASLERPGLDRVRDLVASGGVSVVLAQDRDRFAREPAFLYLLREELGEHGTALRALNDRGDGSPEGDLTDGILDQLARFERAKTAERTRRGRLRKAREGKIVGAQRRAPYGFEHDGNGGYVVDRDAMRVVRRVFEEVAAGRPLRVVKTMLENNGIPTPCDAAFWNTRTLRDMVLSDVYVPHSFEEVRGLVSPGVAAGLDPDRCFGISWYGRRKTVSKQVAEDTPQGRVYRKRQKTTLRDRSEWIAVPVVSSGIPRELVEEARARVAGNAAPSRNASRVWSLSGGVLSCGGCGRPMGTQHVRTYSYYRCGHRRRHGAKACDQFKLYPAAALEDAVWGAVVELTANPHAMLSRMDGLIAAERRKLRGDPGREASAWLKRLEDLDGQRTRAQEMALRGLLDYDELGAKLGELEKARDLAREELAVSRGRAGHVDALLTIRGCFERWAAICDRYEAETPSAPRELGIEEPIWATGPMADRHRAEMEGKTPDERMEVYRELGITAEIDLDGGITLRGNVPLGEGLCISGSTSRRCRPRGSGRTRWQPRR